MVAVLFMSSTNHLVPCKLKCYTVREETHKAAFGNVTEPMPSRENKLYDCG